MLSIIINFFVFALFGYVLSYIFIKFLLKKFLYFNIENHDDIIKEAETQKKELLSNKSKSLKYEISNMTSDLDKELKERYQDYMLSDLELKSRSKYLISQEKHLFKIKNNLNSLKGRYNKTKKYFKEQKSKFLNIRSEYIGELSSKTNKDKSTLIKLKKENILKKFEVQLKKMDKYISEDLDLNAKKYSGRMINKILNRYQPDFVWPKNSNQIELKSDELKIVNKNKYLLNDLKEMASIDIELIDDENYTKPLIRLFGGFGLHKEAVRLTLLEIIKKNNWNKIFDKYKSHKNSLSLEAFHLGKEALKILNIESAHDEIKKLIGYLNWRTSYRQNQWRHSIEVAQISAIIADELGIDKKIAVKAGLYHDLGKGIDYNSDKSHARLSAEKLDLYGESQKLCDIVLSHHDELILETPLADSLKAADTFSGARIGARVNIEEDYQIRLESIEQIINKFKGIDKSIIINGGRQVNINVDCKFYKDSDLLDLSKSIKDEIQDNINFPGYIKVLVNRRFEAISIA